MKVTTRTRVKRSSSPDVIDENDRHSRPSHSMYFETRVRSTPRDFRSPLQRSPRASRRAGTVVMVKSRRSIPASTSSQVSGVDTPAYSLARAL